jgi:cation-transporting ATPase F
LSNLWLLIGVTVQAFGQATFTYLPVMNDLFGTSPIGLGAWSRILLVAAVASFVVALDKRRLRGRAL